MPFLFFSVWSLFKSFLRICPSATYSFVACFVIPSTMFWASGISKDTFTLIGVSLVISEFINLPHIPKGKKIKSYFKRAIGGILIISVKPYVLIALLPAIMLWQMSDKVQRKIKDYWLRNIVLFFSTVIAIIGSFLFLSLLGESMDKFAVDRALETAAIYQEDLKASYHQGQSFDIGRFEPTILGVIKKIPIASFAGIFYPLPGQVMGFVPNVSTIEGVSYLLIILYIVINRFVFRKHYYIPEDKKRVLNFFLLFTFLFSIMLGLSTSNFGAIVRFRVPLIPMLSGYLLINLYYLNNHGYIKPVNFNNR